MRGILKAALAGALVGGGIVWLPLEMALVAVLGGTIALLLNRRRFIQRFHPTSPALAVGIAIATAALTTYAGVRAPLKWVDQRVGPFASPIAALELSARLEERGVPLVFDLYTPEGQEVEPRFSLVMPAKAVTLRELIATIEAQTGLRHRIGYCGTAVTLLFGPHPMGGIRFRPPYPYHRAAQAGHLTPHRTGPPYGGR